MKIPFNLTRVRMMTFINDDKEVVKVAYVYGTGGFKNVARDGENFDVGIEMNKLRIELVQGSTVAADLASALSDAGGPIKVELDVDMRQAEGKPVTLVVTGYTPQKRAA